MHVLAVSLVCAALLAAAPAHAGWREAGPERGHVIDGTACDSGAWVSTRAGVLRSGPGLERWERDPRFPRDTRQLTVSEDERLWASTGPSIWRAGDGAGEVYQVAAGSMVTELVALAAGGVVAVVRGQEQGVLALLPGEGGVLEPVWSLREHDPWALVSHDESVWVATIDGGLWVSRDGARSFDRDRSDRVDALGVVAGRVLAALADGTVLAPEGDRVLGSLPGGRFVAIADDDGVPLLVSTGGGPGLASVLRLVDGAAVPVDLGAFVDEVGLLTPTRAWTLPGRGVLLGTFREGPIHIRGGRASAARAGFRAGMTGGAAISADGSLVLALMGTGTYVSDDGGETWVQEEGGDAPVTDAVEVLALDTRVAVIDFDGLTVRAAEGGWQRWSYPSGLQPGQNQGLLDLAPGPEGSTWAVDAQRGLWQHRDGTWRRCSAAGVVAVDGDGAQTWALGDLGVQLLESCDREPAEAWPGAGRLSGAAAGALAMPWVAVGGALWRDGERIAALPPGQIASIEGQPERVALAYEDGTIVRCFEDGCRSDADSPPNPVRALGWTGDGRLWVAERRGTMLIEDDVGRVEAWHLPGGSPVPDGSLLRLEAPPWLQIQRPQPPGVGPPAQQGQPRPGPPIPGNPAPRPALKPAPEGGHAVPWTLIAGALALAVLGALGFGVWRRRSG